MSQAGTQSHTPLSGQDQALRLGNIQTTIPGSIDPTVTIALEQLETLLAQGAPKYCVLADAAYGVDQAFRQRLADLGLPYVVGITSAVVVWPPGVEPLAPKRYSGRGRPPSMPRRNRSRCQRRLNFPQNRRSKIPQFSGSGISRDQDREPSFFGRPPRDLAGADAWVAGGTRERMCSGSSWACSRSR